MRRLIAVLLVVIALLSGCARAGGGEGPGLVGDYACSAWLPYWDADAALEEARAFPDRYESLICFEAFFDENGDWLLPPESQQILDGLRDVGGAPRPMDYDVNMVSLTVQDAVNVEIFPLEARLAPGEALQLQADVIPAYADDLSVAWRSSDDAVATVSGDGIVTAVNPGACDITAACAGGFEDTCRVEVG